MSAPSATAALAAALRVAAPEHRATHLVTGLTVGDAPPLVAAVVGPSGVGKSSLVNQIAAETVTEAGVLRPTTMAVAKWEADDHSIRLLDAPPSDQFPVEGFAPLRGADLAIVVTTQNRYADAATWACVRAVREAGLPVLLAVNRLDGAVSDLVIDEVSERLDGEPIAILEGELAHGAAAIRAILDAAAAELTSVRAARRHATVGHAAAAVRSLALELTIEAERWAVLDDAVADADDEASVADDVLAATAAHDDATLVAAACTVIDDTSDRVVAPLVVVWESLGLSAPNMSSVSNTLRVDDARAVMAWRSETTERFLDAVRPRWLRRWAAARIGSRGWQIAITGDREFRGPMRLCLGGRVRPAAAESARLMSATLTERVRARVGVFRNAMPVPPAADPDLLQTLASRLEAEHPPVPSPSFLAGATH
jgi:signal recognition particle receptor subunit beta